MSKWLRSLRGDVRPWANRSGCSEEMSEWVISSKNLAKNLKSCLSMFYIRFIKKKIEKMGKSLIFTHFLFFGERCEWIAHFAQIKWVMWANRSGRSPKMSDHERFAQVTHDKWANCSFFYRVNCLFALLFTKNKQFTQVFFYLNRILLYIFCTFLKVWAIRSFPLL